MKKFFAAALATAMVVSMAATSFAAAAGSATGAVVGFDATAQKYSTTSYFSNLNSGKIAYGKAIFYKLETTSNNYVTLYDAVKGISIKQKWELNGSAIEKLEIVKKKYGANSTDYAYYLSVKTKSNNTTSNTDVVGTVTLRKSGSDGFQFANEMDIPVNFILGYDLVVTEVTDTTSLMFNTALTGDQTITFAEAPDNYFDVNVDGQGKLLVAADVEYNSDIANKYPQANLDFFNGNGASFNKIGELTIAAAPGSFLYQINADGNLTAVKATYDEYEEAFKVKTRTLGKYVISDVELKLTATAPVDTTKPNPGTGANA